MSTTTTTPNAKPRAGEHTKGPWRTHDALVLFPGGGGCSLQNCPSPEANARRIVACVNACEGLTEKELTDLGNIAAFLDKAAASTGPMLVDRERLKKQNAELIEALGDGIRWVSGNGKPLVDELQIGAYNKIRTLLAKHGR